MGYLLLALFMIQSEARAGHTLFVVDQLKTTGSVDSYSNHAHGRDDDNHTAPSIIAELAKKCSRVDAAPQRDGAQYILASQAGLATLTDQHGVVLYVSHAKTRKNMVRDVCAFIDAR